MAEVQDTAPCRKPPSTASSAASTLEAGGKAYAYYGLQAGRAERPCRDRALPFSLKVLLENLLRHEDGRTVTSDDIEAMADWLVNRGKADREIAFRPARVLMQDFTGVPAVVDLAAMRDAMKALGGDPQQDQSARYPSISSSTIR